MKLTNKKLDSFDGTRIAYQVMGTGKKTIVLCNGLGGSVAVWAPFVDFFGKKYRFICWDYRGLFKSDPPLDEGRLTIADHAHDLFEICRKEKVKKAVLVGWSMGVQVALEFYRHHLEVVQGLVLINGTSGYPFKTALGNPLSRFLIPKINELMQRVGPALQPTIKPMANRFIDWKGFIQLISKLGLAHENLDSKIFKQVAKGIVSADLHYYHENLRYLGEHDASDMLHTIKVPTLVISSDQDLMTPLSTAHHMASKIPGSEFLIIPGGSHYALLEFPDVIHLRSQQFLKENY